VAREDIAVLKNEKINDIEPEIEAREVDEIQEDKGNEEEYTMRYSNTKNVEGQLQSCPIVFLLNFPPFTCEWVD